jgi:hypothetical protein
MITCTQLFMKDVTLSLILRQRLPIHSVALGWAAGLHKGDEREVCAVVQREKGG